MILYQCTGIHAFFGAFVSGLCIPRNGELTDFLGLRIELIIVEFFLPFVYVAILGKHLLPKVSLNLF